MVRRAARLAELVKLSGQHGVLRSARQDLVEQLLRAVQLGEVEAAASESEQEGGVAGLEPASDFKVINGPARFAQAAQEVPQGALRDGIVGRQAHGALAIL